VKKNLKAILVLGGALLGGLGTVFFFQCTRDPSSVIIGILIGAWVGEFVYQKAFEPST